MGLKAEGNILRSGRNGGLAGMRGGLFPELVDELCYKKLGKSLSACCWFLLTLANIKSLKHFVNI